MPHSASKPNWPKANNQLSYIIEGCSKERPFFVNPESIPCRLARINFTRGKAQVKYVARPGDPGPGILKTILAHHANEYGYTGSLRRSLFQAVTGASSSLNSTNNNSFIRLTFSADSSSFFSPSGCSLEGLLF